MSAYIRAHIAFVGDEPPNEERIRKILRNAVSGYQNWRGLDSCEPAICSADGKKQLRCVSSPHHKFYHLVADYITGKLMWCLKLTRGQTMIPIDDAELKIIARLLMRAISSEMGYGGCDVFIVTETNLCGDEEDD